ncbi:MAG TPA: hypothetical protein VJK09_01865 [Candidatus Paceibacterota bacterium]
MADERFKESEISTPRFAEAVLTVIEVEAELGYATDSATLDVAVDLTIPSKEKTKLEKLEEGLKPAVEELEFQEYQVRNSLPLNILNWALGVLASGGFCYIILGGWLTLILLVVTAIVTAFYLKLRG